MGFYLDARVLSRHDLISRICRRHGLVYRRVGLAGEPQKILYRGIDDGHWKVAGDVATSECEDLRSVRSDSPKIFDVMNGRSPWMYRNLLGEEFTEDPHICVRGMTPGEVAEAHEMTPGEVPSTFFERHPMPNPIGDAIDSAVQEMIFRPIFDSIVEKIGDDWRNS